MDFELTNLFDGFNTQDSYAILFITLIGFLFGLLLGYLLRTRRVIALKRELKAEKKKLEQATAEIAILKEQIDLKDTDLKKASFDREELEAKVLRLEGEKHKLYNQVLNLSSDLERIQSSSKTYTDTIEDLQNQLVGLKAQNVQLNQEVKAEEETVNDLAQIQSIYNATRNRLEAMEVKVNRIETENQDLKQELSSLRVEQASLREEHHQMATTTSQPVVLTTTPVEETKVDNQELEEEPTGQPTEKKVLQERIVVDGIEKDDLTRIEGIGPFLEKQLNGIGIYRFEDIAQLNQQGIDQVTKAIGYFPGRIERDDWVGQAQKLAKAKADNPEDFKKGSALAVAGADDLKIIEGIGPKIEQILKDAGINTWEELAESNADHLRKVLDAAGDRFRMHDPGTWPAQARLAANQEWDLLKEYQDELKGGRLVD